MEVLCKSGVAVACVGVKPFFYLLCSPWVDIGSMEYDHTSLGNRYGRLYVCTELRFIMHLASADVSCVYSDAALCLVVTQ